MILWVAEMSKIIFQNTKQNLVIKINLYALKLTQQYVVKCLVYSFFNFKILIQKLIN